MNWPQTTLTLTTSTLALTTGATILLRAIHTLVERTNQLRRQIAQLQRDTNTRRDPSVTIWWPLTPEDLTETQDAYQQLRDTCQREHTDPPELWLTAVGAPTLWQDHTAVAAYIPSSMVVAGRDEHLRHGWLIHGDTWPTSEAARLFAEMRPRNTRTA